MYVNTSAFKLRSFKELLHFSPRIVERVWGWFGGVSVGRSGWRSVGGWMLYSVYSCILCFQTYSLGTMWRFFFLNSDSGRVACRNNRSACPQKFNGFGLVPRDLSWLIIVHLTYEYLLIFAEHLRLLSRYPISCHLPLESTWFSPKPLLLLPGANGEFLRKSINRAKIIEA